MKTAFCFFTPAFSLSDGVFWSDFQINPRHNLRRKSIFCFNESTRESSLSRQLHQKFQHQVL